MSTRPDWIRVSDDGKFIIVSRCNFMYRGGARSKADYDAMDKNDGDICIAIGQQGLNDERDLRYILNGGG